MRQRDLIADLVLAPQPDGHRLPEVRTESISNEGKFELTFTNEMVFTGDLEGILNPKNTTNSTQIEQRDDLLSLLVIRSETEEIDKNLIDWKVESIS